MGFTHRSRIHKQSMSRRRTQFPTKKTEAENDIGTSGDTGDNKTRKEISLKEACKVCFQELQDQHITTMMTRRMSHCLQMAGWRKDGKFNSGPQRNQARFVKDAEEAFDGDNAHERDCF